MKKIKIFTHSDLDGVGSVVLSKLLLKNTIVHYETHGYNTINEAVKSFIGQQKEDEYDAIYITDISVNDSNLIATIDTLYACGHEIRLFDHHKTAKELDEYQWATVNIDKPNCGTSLFFKFLLEEKKDEIDLSSNNLEQAVKNYVLYTSHWDTWLWKKYNNITCKRLNDLVYIQGIDNYINNMVHKLSALNTIFTQEEEQKLNDRQKEIDYYIQRKNKSLIKTSDLNGYTIGVTFADNFISELGNDLLVLNKDIEYIMIVDLSNKRISLRAREEDDIDVGVIAESKGGGGHKAAAGYTINEDNVLNLLNNIL